MGCVRGCSPVTDGFLADENFNRRIVAGLVRRAGDLDLVRVQDVGLLSADDPAVLTWAADHSRVLLTHDAATIPDFAHGRIAAGDAMVGVFIVPATMASGDAIEDLALLAEASLDDEWTGQVRYLPFR